MSSSQVDGFIMEPNKIFAYNVGVSIRGITFKWKDDSVLMIVKTYDKKNKPIIAFIECYTYYDCWEYLYSYLTKRDVPLKWREDRYANVAQSDNPW